jgi:AraC-like DNA-binding protein
MSLIATLLPRAVQVQRLRAALRDRHELRECDDWPSLLRACDQEPVRVAIVDPYADGPANFDGLRTLTQRLPRLTVIMYLAMSPERTHDVFDAARVGVDGLVLMGEDDAPRALLAVVEKSESKSLAGLIRRSLDGVDPVVADCVLLAVARAHERLSPLGLAKLLALHRRTVTQRLNAAGFPPPQRLITWGRLIVAASMLEDAHRSADRIATTLGFPSGSAFRNICQRYLHATPGEIRARGGAAYVIRTLLRHVGDRAATRSLPPRRSVARGPAVLM